VTKISLPTGHPEFEHRSVHFHEDKRSGLRAIIAIHRSWAAPSVGGCRVADYGSDEEALDDVLRLSKGMTFKSVMAGLNYGGAKAVIIGVPQAVERNKRLDAFAAIVNSMRGAFRTGVDVGLAAKDVDRMAQSSRYVVDSKGLAPDALTADGVIESIKAACACRFRGRELSSLRFVVVGLGKVGGRVARVLTKAGAEVVGADVDADIAASFVAEGGKLVAPHEAASSSCDVLIPCALGRVLNEASIPKLACSIVVGAANNQLAEANDAERLHARNIIYVPDYVANAGGLIAVAAKIEGRDENWAAGKILELGNTVQSLIQSSRSRDCSPETAARAIASERAALLEATR
jgi:leucine dehydrogenase